jgi:hypothetical protein
MIRTEEARMLGRLGVLTTDLVDMREDLRAK